MVPRPNTALSQIHTQVMWSRLIAVVEEQAQTMIRTAFSTSVREAGDLSAGVFDRHGRMLALHRRDRIDNSPEPARRESRLDHRSLDAIWDREDLATYGRRRPGDEA